MNIDMQFSLLSGSNAKSSKEDPVLQSSFADEDSFALLLEDSQAEVESAESAGFARFRPALLGQEIAEPPVKKIPTAASEHGLGPFMLQAEVNELQPEAIKIEDPANAIKRGGRADIELLPIDDDLPIRTQPEALDAVATEPAVSTSSTGLKLPDAGLSEENSAWLALIGKAREYDARAVTPNTERPSKLVQADAAAVTQWRESDKNVQLSAFFNDDTPPVLPSDEPPMVHPGKINVGQTDLEQIEQIEPLVDATHSVKLLRSQKEAAEPQPKADHLPLMSGDPVVEIAPIEQQTKHAIETNTPPLSFTTASQTLMDRAVKTETPLVNDNAANDMRLDMNDNRTVSLVEQDVKTVIDPAVVAQNKVHAVDSELKQVKPQAQLLDVTPVTVQTEPEHAEVAAIPTQLPTVEVLVAQSAVAAPASAPQLNAKIMDVTEALVVKVEQPVPLTPLAGLSPAQEASLPSVVLTPSQAQGLANNPPTFASHQKMMNQQAAALQKQQIKVAAEQNIQVESAPLMAKVSTESAILATNAPIDPITVQRSGVLPELAATLGSANLGQSSGQAGQFSQSGQQFQQIFQAQQNERVTAQSSPLALFAPDAAAQLKERVMFQVNQKIQTAEIRLNPEELGSVQIKVALQQDQLSVQFIVQQQGAKEALEQQMPRLKELLQEQGLALTEGHVSQEKQQQQESRQASAEWQSGRVGPAEPDTAPTAQATVRVSDRMVDYYA